MRRAVLRGAGAGLLVAGCCLLPAAGAAGSTRSDEITLTADGQTGTATAHCPHGQRATGGGFSASPPVQTMSSNTTAKVYESRKTGQHGWRVSAQESTYPVAASVDVTAYVYCSKHAPKTKTAAHSVPAKPEDFTISDARCGSGNVQAGGFAMSTPNFDGGLIASQRLGKRGWRTRIDSDIGVTATTLAYCAEKPAPRGIKGSIPSTGREFISGVTPACPAGHRPLAGGFAQPDAITGFAGNDYRNFVPYESTRSGRDWENAGYHGGDTESHLIPLAYCR